MICYWLVAALKRVELLMLRRVMHCFINWVLFSLLLCTNFDIYFSSYLNTPFVLSLTQLKIVTTVQMVSSFFNGSMQQSGRGGMWIRILASLATELAIRKPAWFLHFSTIKVLLSLSCVFVSTPWPGSIIADSWVRYVGSIPYPPLTRRQTSINLKPSLLCGFVHNLLQNPV